MHHAMKRLHTVMSVFYPLFSDISFFSGFFFSIFLFLFVAAESESGLRTLPMDRLNAQAIVMDKETAKKKKKL